MLIRFFKGNGEGIPQLIDELKRNAFAYDSYVLQGDPDPLLGALAAQAAAFSTMALRLARLSENFGQRTWLHAAEVIKDQLAVAYSANCALMRHVGGEGVDLLIRPRIESSLLSNHLHRAAVSQWLEAHGSDVEPGLVTDIRTWMEELPANPTDADTAGLSVPALAVRLEGQRGCTEFVDIMRYRFQRGIDTVSPFLVEAVQQIHSAFADLEDFRRLTFRRPFLDIAIAAIEFAAVRLDSSFEVNKSVAYLFRSRNPNPVEDDLQQDFHDWSGARGVRLEYEPKGVAGGRGDLRYDGEGCRIYVEAKQESKDASFDALIDSYGSQTSQYQATSAKLGVMLVLDKTRPGRAPYPLQDAFKTIVTTQTGHARGLVVVRVPALRPTPHEASK
jgi:hypothetical protein